LKVDPELSDGTAPAGAGQVLIGCRYGLRSKDVEMNANDNPALNIEDSSTKGTICTRKSESMCGSSLHTDVCAGYCVLLRSGCKGAVISKTKIIGENQKISTPDGNLLNPHLNPICTHLEKSGVEPGSW